MAQETLFSGIAPDILQKRKKVKQPAFIKPMLATLTNNYFSSKDWIYEHKFDGERCLAFKKNGTVTLKSRNNKIINREYPELVDALTAGKADNFIIDGEIVAIGKYNVSDFQLLQSRINLKNDMDITKQTQHIPIHYCVFDIMYAAGYDLCDLPLFARKSILKKLITFKLPLVYSKHRRTKGLIFFKEACKLHWEGLIAKKMDSLYVSQRSPAWLKFKCVMEQELVVIGFTQPQGSRTDFGALLVGYYKDTKLYYAGKVGTGYDQATLTMLGKKLRPLQTKTSPVQNYDESLKGVHWVKPVLVAEFKFANWTTKKKLRVGRYKGLRDDKDAKDVVREVPKAIAIIKKPK